MALAKTYAGYCFAANILYSCKLKLQITMDRFLPFLTMSAQSRFSTLPQLRHSPNFLLVVRLTQRQISKILTHPALRSITYWLLFLVRAGEMIPEVGGGGDRPFSSGPPRPWGPSPLGTIPKWLKGPKTTYTTIAIAEKQSKRSKKGPFSLYILVPQVPPRKWN